jgi:hypothetical protein
MPADSSIQQDKADSLAYSLGIDPAKLNIKDALYQLWRDGRDGSDRYIAVAEVEKLLEARDKEIERKARTELIQAIIDDCLTPERVGGHFIHGTVKEFANQLKGYLEEQREELSS